MFFELAQATVEGELDNYPAHRARILADIGWIYFRRSRIDQAQNYLIQALALVEGSNQYDIIATIYNRLGGVAYQQGNLADAAGFTRQSLQIRETIGDIVGVARSYNNLGLLAYEMGHWGEALENYQKNLELQTRIGDMDGLAISYVNIGNLLVDLGDFDEAHANIYRSLQAAEQTGAMFHIAFAHLTFGRLAIWQGQYREALTQLADSLQVFKEIGAQEQLVNVYYLLGEANLGLDDPESAERWARRTSELIDRLGSQSVRKSDQHGLAIRLTGKVALFRHDWEQAGQDLHEALEIFTAIDPDGIEQARTRLELARLAQLQGHDQEGRMLAAQAVEVFRRYGASHDERTAIKIFGGKP